MAVKIVRQPDQIALLGSPSSAAAMSAGRENAPAALRAARLAERLRQAGYQVTDLGDDPPRLFAPDEENPRARNIQRVLAAIESLKPRVELAVKSGALPLVLAGDCFPVLAIIAGVRRYFRHAAMIYMDRDADLHTPANTTTGSLDGMTVSHATGRGAAEVVRFWGEPPLIRDPDLALFGVERMDPAEEQTLGRVPLRSYSAAQIMRMGTAAAAKEAVERIHGSSGELILHLGVDVIAGFEATDDPGAGGLSADAVREALAVFASQKHLAAISVAAYNPARDADGRGAKQVVDLLVEMLEKRRRAFPSAPTSATAGAPEPAPQKASAQVAGAEEARPAETHENETASNEEHSEGGLAETASDPDDSHS